MKHTKIIILLVAFLGLSVVASAQLSQGKNGLVDEKAKEVITKAQNKIKSTEGISFVSYVVVKDQEKKERERHEAKVLLAGNKYRIYVKNHAFYSSKNTSILSSSLSTDNTYGLFCKIKRF